MTAPVVSLTFFNPHLSLKLFRLFPLVILHLQSVKMRASRMSKFARESLQFNFSTVIVIIFFSFPFHGRSQTPDQEHAILLGLKQHWDNPASLNHWTSSNTSHCSWPEIECTKNGSGAVTRVSLFNLSISGTIPPSICALRSLRVIDFSNNEITGGFPTVLYNCSGLEYLNLSKNYFSGQLPRDVDRMAGLRALNLSVNNFSGPIPASIGRLPQLQSLSLLETTFNGTFPPEFGNLSNLEFLEAADIGFAPTRIPLSFTWLKKLKYVFMARSNLEGEIPETIGDMAALEYLDLSENKLTGKIPGSLFLLKNLSFVYLYKNNLSGEIPSAVRSLNLVEIDLGQNNLTGLIPEEFGNLEKLEYLSVFMNRLSGEIPGRIGRLPKLTEVRFFTNNLSGPLPPDFGRYSPLEAFQVADNNFIGELPEFLCTAGRLVGVVASNNNLTGELPISLGNCSTLEIIKISGNGFTGSIPTGVWTSSNLLIMMISDNLFSGELPENLAPNLSRLEMSNNRFSGEIPDGFPSQKNLAVFEASNNLFVGSIPRELTALPSLETLLLDENKLSGHVPAEIISWESLTALNLSRNELSGPIPAGIGHLPRLIYLDLSENQFSGQIPATLADLRLLNLSSNNLSGRIPAELQNTVYKSGFLNNPSLCSTNPSLNLSSCYDARPKKSNPISSRFVAVILGIAAAIFLLAVLFSIFVIRAIRQRKHESNPKCKLTSFQRVKFTEADIFSKLTEDNLIGGGGSGKVYRAVVNDSGNEIVAVKNIWTDRNPDMKLKREFVAEIEILSTIRHYNIVKLLCCIYGDNSSQLLVYEYMENRSLDLWLHRSKSTAVAVSAAWVPHGALDWPKRLRIAVGAAQGLCYMHHHCSPPVIHRDVKSSNILLDSEFNAKVADFGLARLLKKQGEVDTMSAVQGSFGYMAPEYAQSVSVNEKIDVYSFGVVLLELATGREAGDAGEHGCLVEYAHRHIQQGRPIPEALDKEIKDESGYVDEMSSVFKLGILCTRAAPQTRPSMREVVQVLLQCSQPLAYREKNVRREYEGAPLLRSSTENKGDFASMV